MNLGWKLAATIRGDAPEGLLDSYTTERHPIGARILEWTRAQVAVMRPNRQARALEAVLRDLLRAGTGLLLDYGRQASLQALDGQWGDRVRYVARDAVDRLGLCALLVRPDGFVAWASDTMPSPEEVTRAAARWFAAASS